MHAHAARARDITMPRRENELVEVRATLTSLGLGGFPPPAGQPQSNARNPRVHDVQPTAPALRTSTIVVRNVDCAVAESALRQFLMRLPGVSSFQTDSLRGTVQVTYDVGTTSAAVINRLLRSYGFHPAGCTLTLPWKGHLATADIAQLTLRIPPPFRTPHGWALLQNHALSRDGIKACVVSTDGATAYLSYDAAVCGGRDLVTYIGGSGIECSVESQDPVLLEHTLGRLSQRVPGGAGLIAILIACLLWVHVFPPQFLETCIIGGLSGVRLAQLAVGFVTTVVVGATPLEVGFLRWRKTARPCAHCIVSTAAFILFLAGCANTAVSVLSVCQDESLPVLALTTASWIFVLWCVGRDVSYFLKARVCRDVDQHRCVSSVSRFVRFESGETDVIQELVHPGDKLIVKAGERVRFDGIALTPATVQEPPLVASNPDLRPMEKEPGSAVLRGSLVMRSDLTLRVTTVGKSQLRTALSQLQMHQAAASRIVDWAFAYYVICAIIGTVVGLYWVRLGLASEIGTPSLAEAIATGLSVGAAIHLLGLTEPLRLLACAVPECATGYLASLGCGVFHPSALRKAAEVTHVVISPSALPGTFEIAGLLVAPDACSSVANRLQWTAPVVEEEGDCTGPAPVVLTPSPPATVVEGHQEAALLIWTVIAQLQSSTAPSRLNGFLLDHVPKGVVPTPSMSQSSQTFPGQGVEGSWSLMKDPEGSQPPFLVDGAMGSLEFISACHYRDTEDLRPAWDKLRYACECYIAGGYDIAVVSTFGTPIGAVIWKFHCNPCARQALAYCHKSLGVPVWVVSGKHPSASQALSQETGVPEDHVVCGATPTERVRFLTHLAEALVYDEGGQIGVVAEGSQRRFLSLVTSRLGTQTLRICSGSDTFCEAGAEVAWRPRSIVHLLNLVRIARHARFVRRLSLFLLLACLGGALALFTTVIPTRVPTQAPVLALLVSLGTEWLVLVLALSVAHIDPIRHGPSGKQPAGIRRGRGSTNGTTLCSASLIFPQPWYSKASRRLCACCTWLLRRHFSAPSGQFEDDAEKLLAHVSLDVGRIQRYEFGPSI